MMAQASWVEHRSTIAFFLGMLSTLLGYVIARIFFPEQLSVPMLLLSTMLLIPSLMKLLKREAKQKKRFAYQEIVEVYLFLFLGIFFVYLILGFTVGNFQEVFSYQLDALAAKQGVTKEHLVQFFQQPFQPSFEPFLAILEHDLRIAVLFFVLSFFYGAGAIFLLMLNASTFASFVVFVHQQLTQNVASFFILLGLFSIHLLPEVLGFLLAAIAGGIVSGAMMQERFLSPAFRSMLRHASRLLILACLVIILASLLEVYVTPGLLYGAL